MNARERLIEATRDLLWERGYVGTSPRDILSRSGAGQGSMYHHFSGKEELAAAALQRSAREFADAAASDLLAAGSAFDRISAYLLRPREALKGCRVGRMAEDPEVVSHPSLHRPIEEAFSGLRAQITDLLSAGQKSGEFSKSFSPENVGATIVAVVQGGYVLARAAGSSQPFDDAIIGAIELLARVRISPGA